MGNQLRSVGGDYDFDAKRGYYFPPLVTYCPTIALSLIAAGAAPRDTARWVDEQIGGEDVALFKVRDGSNQKQPLCIEGG